MMRNSFSTSAEESAEVGSSMTISRDCIDSARAISTICCSATRKIAHERVRLEAEPEPVGDGQRVGRHLAPVHERARAGLAADEDVFGDRHIRRERELLVDRDNAEPLRVVRRGEHRRPLSSEIEPASGCWAPDRIFSSVDLPAPFSPSSAWTSPGANFEARRRQAPARRESAC